MAQVVLDRPRILAIVGELVPAAMPQHVAANQEREFRRTPRRVPPSADSRTRSVLAGGIHQPARHLTARLALQAAQGT